MLEVTKQRPMNNEYVNIINWQTVTRDLGWHFYQHCKQETTRSSVRSYSARFSLELQKELCS